MCRFACSVCVCVCVSSFSLSLKFKHDVSAVYLGMSSAVLCVCVCNKVAVEKRVAKNHVLSIDLTEGRFLILKY